MAMNQCHAKDLEKTRRSLSIANVIAVLSMSTKEITAISPATPNSIVFGDRLKVVNGVTKSRIVATV